MKPPLILWSQDKSARSLKVFEAADHFVVNVLSADQFEVSNTFASQGADKFKDVAHRPGLGDAPMLDGCAARFQCRKTFTYEGGDHLIFVGEVLVFDEFEREALLFHKGQYSVSEPHPISSTAVKGHQPSGFVADYLDYLLSQAAHRIENEFDAVLEREGLDRAQFRVLCTLSDHTSGISAGELSMIDLMPTDVIERHLAILIDNDWVAAEVAIDGSYVYRLTPVGREKIIPVVAAAKAHEDELLSAFSATSARQLKDMLKTLIGDR